MPRTKRPNKKSVKIPDVDENALTTNDNMVVYLQSMSSHFEQEMSKLEAIRKDMITSLENAVELAKIRIPPAIGNRSVKMINAEDVASIGEVTSTCITPDVEAYHTAHKPATRNRSRTGDAEPALPTRTTRNRSHSSGNSATVLQPRTTRNRSHSRDNSATVLPVRDTRSSSQTRDNNDMPPPVISRNNRFRTPNVNLAPGGQRYNTITPKVNPGCPLSILRRPREGELAFAMSGSPLLVSSAMGGDQVANVNFPLTDGRVMSILPQLGLRPHDMPAVDQETLLQLQRLRENLNSILGLQHS